MSQVLAKVTAKLRKNQPNRKIVKAYKIDDNEILVTAPDTTVEGVDYSDPFFIYAIDKDLLCPFAPMMNIKKYEKAMKNEIKI